MQHPYQLHAVIFHCGESGAGHYLIDVWNSERKLWYRMDDTNSQPITWDALTRTAYGGLDKQTSAACLVYVDVFKAERILV